jgi:hypothetical protein
LTAAPPTETGTPTETQNPVLAVTLGNGTVAAGTASLTSTVGVTPPTGTPNPAIGATPTETLHPRFFGTVPPDPPFGHIGLVNKSKAEAYISLQCVSPDGRETIIEYPVRRSVSVKAPAGSYFFVAWVGGRQMTGSFHLGKDAEITLTLFKDRVEVVSNN